MERESRDQKNVSQVTKIPHLVPLLSSLQIYVNRQMLVRSNHERTIAVLQSEPKEAGAWQPHVFSPYGVSEDQL